MQGRETLYAPIPSSTPCGSTRRRRAVKHEESVPKRGDRQKNPRQRYSIVSERQALSYSIRRRPGARKRPVWRLRRSHAVRTAWGKGLDGSTSHTDVGTPCYTSTCVSCYRVPGSPMPRRRGECPGDLVRLHVLAAALACLALPKCLFGAARGRAAIISPL